MLPPGVGSVRLLLDGGEQETLTRSNGEFELHDVAQGKHSLDVICTGLVFPAFKIKVETSGKVRALEYAYPGAQPTAAKVPLKIRHVAQPIYFTPKPQPSIMSVLTNPQVMLMLGMLGLTFCMPSASSQSKEEKEQMQQQMESMGMGAGGAPDISSMMSKLMGGGRGGDVSDDED